MMKDWTRREMLRFGGGLVLAGGMLHSDALGQGTPKDLVFRTTDPRNGEPKLDRLVRSWITPVPHFYVRSHAPNPQINTDTYRLKVEGLVRRPLSLSLGELKQFEKRETTATLTCAGNRRAEFNREGKVGGVQWQAGAIGNATWGGASLAEVLAKTEIAESAKHVWFEGLDEIPKSGKIIPFGGSVPIEKAMEMKGRGAPLLASSMNGEPLTADHGFPLRTLVPGYIGARSVKWLGRIVVSDRPSPNHYLATAYKVVKDTTAIDWAESGPIYRFPINAAICTPGKGGAKQLKSGKIELQGYALPTGRPGCVIKAVSVSTDTGKTWTKAELTGDSSEYCWQLWKASANLTSETKRIIVRATDSQGHFMPARVPWNAKGYLQNSWYRLPVTVDG